MSSNFLPSPVQMIGIDELKKHSGSFFVLGLALIILGIAAVIASFTSTIASVLFFGCLLIFAGLLQAGHALMSKQWGSFFLDLVTGLFSIAVGLICASRPIIAAEALTLIIALFLIMVGILRMAAAFAIKPHYLFLLVVHGIINLLLGLFILQDWPESGLWVIGLFIGIDIIFNGLSLVFLGYMGNQVPAH